MPIKCGFHIVIRPRVSIWQCHRPNRNELARRQGHHPTHHPLWVPHQQAVGRMSCQSKLIAGYTSLILLGTCSRFATRATYVQINIIINKDCSLARVLRLRKTLALVLRRLIGLINRTQLASRIAFGGYWQRNENRKRIRNRNNSLLTPLVVLPIHYAIISNDFRKWYFLWLSCRQGNAFIKANGKRESILAKWG